MLWRILPHLCAPCCAAGGLPVYASALISPCTVFCLLEERNRTQSSSSLFSRALSSRALLAICLQSAASPMSSDAPAASPGVAVIDAFPEASVHLARGSAVLAAALVAGSASASASAAAPAPAAPAGGAITGVFVAQVLSSSAEAAVLEEAVKLTTADAARLTAEAADMAAAAARADTRGARRHMCAADTARVLAAGGHRCAPLSAPPPCAAAASLAPLLPAIAALEADTDELCAAAAALAARAADLEAAAVAAMAAAPRRAP